MHKQWISPPKVVYPNQPNVQDVVISISNYTTPQMKSRSDASTRKKPHTIWARQIPIYPDPVYWPPAKPVKTLIPEIPGSLLDINPEPNMDFKDNSPF